MKYLTRTESRRTLSVTPCVGVWIEIYWRRKRRAGRVSLPAWECGLKYGKLSERIGAILSLPAWECGLKSGLFSATLLPVVVTPCVGVWIEICRCCRQNFYITVTPCVGVWIEILYHKHYNYCYLSHSLRGSVD